MSTEFWLRGITAALYGGAFVWRFACCGREEGGGDAAEYGERERARYQPCIAGYLLPLFIAGVLGLSFLLFDNEKAGVLTLTFCVNIFPHIALYYLLLMPALPFLRRRISARACAMLWMIPNYLYLTQMKIMELPEPLWVVRVPGRLLERLLLIWGVGFLIVFGWRLASHLVFRFRILHGSSVITDPEILAVWREELARTRLRKTGIRLVTSPAARTPLSVGLFSRRIRVVLPKRPYSPEELGLIFRHEIVHIGREDSWSKFFLVFCTAMCWFNPLMWAAMKRSAEDLELSCDEAVLRDSGDGDRRRYAELLLQTAGDERGFTTCLSASASSLRYRLKAVVGLPKQHSGALVVGAAFFFLCMSCGYTALSYGDYTGAELIYQSQDPGRYRLSSAAPETEEALSCYLSSLRMETITGNYSFSADERTFRVVYNTPEGVLVVLLSDHAAKIWAGGSTGRLYYLPDGVDWALLDSLAAAIP